MTLPVLILAGGLGTRLEPVTGGTLPKAMVPVNGRPFIDHKLEDLARRGVTEVLLLTGYHGDILATHVGDGDAYSLRVRCVADGPALLGTGGAIRAVLALLPDAFWITYGDSLVDVDLAAAERAFRRAGRGGLMTVLHNRDAWGPSNVVVDGDLVTAYAKDPRPAGAEHIDYGMLILTAASFDAVTTTEAFDLSEVLRLLVERHDLTAFEVTTRFYEIGTPEALRETEIHLARYPHQPPTGSPAP